MLRKLSISIASSSVSLCRINTTMTTINNNSNLISSRLAALAQQLRLYKPPDLATDKGGVSVSQVDFTGDQKVNPNPNRAAVLICLFHGNNDGDDLRVILTKRSSALSSHSGEVSLPGGKTEEADVDDADTATREAKEEIGLEPSLVEVVTVLEPYLSKLPGSISNDFLRVASKHKQDLGSKYHITPQNHVYQGQYWCTAEFLFQQLKGEVDEIFDAPLEMFIKDENHKSEEREWLGNNILIHYFDYETTGKKYMIWGLTAAILIRAASVVYQRPPAFIEQTHKMKLPGVVSKDTKSP